MRARLYAKTGELAGSSFEIAGEATLGRTPDNRVVLPSALVSAHHARIAWSEELASFTIEDLGSRNGTFLGGRKVEGVERLERLEVISFADQLDFVFQVPVADPEAPAPPPPPPPAPIDDGTLLGGTFLGIEPAPLPAALLAASADAGGAGEATRLGPIEAWRLPVLEAPLASSFRLEVERTEGQLQIFALAPGEHLVGRAPDCDIAIDDPALSRRHCRLIVTASEVRAADCGSTNRTFLTGEPISGEVVVAPGVELRFGTIAARIVVETGGRG